MAEKLNKITKEGKEELEKRLKQIIEIERPKAQDDLNAARQLGDLSENADYDTARAIFESLNNEVAKIQHTLDHCEIIEKSTDNLRASVGGGTITVFDKTHNLKKTFRIVGAVEAKPTEGKISNTCPVAQAVIGHVVGDVVTVQVKEPYELEIVSID